MIDEYSDFEILSEKVQKLMAGAKVLDLGCGTGRYFHVIQENLFLAGLDITFSMLQEARHPFKSRTGYTNLIQGDIFNLPFKNNSLDFIYSFGVLGEHLPLTHQILEEVERTLKSSGNFIFSTRPQKFQSKIIRFKKKTKWLAGMFLYYLAPPGEKKNGLQERLLIKRFYAEPPDIDKLCKKLSLQRLESKLLFKPIKMKDGTIKKFRDGTPRYFNILAKN